MFARLSSLVLCLALVSVSCHNPKPTPLLDLDYSSGNVLADPTVEFVDMPAYIDNEKLVFKVRAKNELASSFVHLFLHGQDVSCDDAGTWQAGSFNTHITIEDTHDHGDRLLCIKGMDADGRMASVYVSAPLKKEAPQPATANVDVMFSITGSIMSVSKPDTSSATGFKWCVIDASEDCPTPEEEGEEKGQYNDGGNCNFADGVSLPQDVNLGIGGEAADREFLACVVGIGGDKHSLIVSDEAFTNGNQQPVTGGQPDPAAQGGGQQPSYPANDGKLESSYNMSFGYYVVGKHVCSTMPFFKNSGTEEITVKFNYRNDSGIQKERREQIFSEIVYQVYPIADHIQVREALIDSYCRRGELGAGKIIRNGDTFKLPAGHQVITVLKQKDPTHVHHDARYFNGKGHACIEMRLTDLNNDTEINKYRCASRTELELYKGATNKLTRDSNGEYNVELSRHKEDGNRHLRLTVVNATIEKAVAAGLYEREYAEKLYKDVLVWRLIGDPDQNVPAWLYYFGANFSKKNEEGVEEELTDSNQFQFGRRVKKIDAGKAQMPAAGTKYRLLILSNSLSDKPCQRSLSSSGYYEYVVKQNNAQGETRKTKRNSFWFCPREDVLNITIVDP